MGEPASPPGGVRGLVSRVVELGGFQWPVARCRRVVGHSGCRSGPDTHRTGCASGRTGGWSLAGVKRSPGNRVGLRISSGPHHPERSPGPSGRGSRRWSPARGRGQVYQRAARDPHASPKESGSSGTRSETRLRGRSWRGDLEGSGTGRGPGSRGGECHESARFWTGSSLDPERSGWRSLQVYQNFWKINRPLPEFYRRPGADGTLRAPCGNLLRPGFFPLRDPGPLSSPENRSRWHGPADRTGRSPGRRSGSEIGPENHRGGAPAPPAA